MMAVKAIARQTPSAKIRNDINHRTAAVAVAEAETDDFSELIKIAGLDPARDLRFFDWSGVDFSGADLSGYDFTGAILLDCRFEGAHIAGACFDAARLDRTELRQAADWESYVSSWPPPSSPPSGRHLPDLAVFSDAPFAPEMVVIPAGAFLMGSPRDERERHKDEGPQRQVTLAQPFGLGRYPVTFEEYDYFCTATGRPLPEDRGWERGRRPVINVNWSDARAYADWLSAQTRQTYRLPSEAEWEYACRAGRQTRWCFGNEQSRLSDYAWFESNADGKTHPVGEKEANAFGLYDMHGNVWEWVEDGVHINCEGAPVDGSAWLDSITDHRVYRGGSWSSLPWVLRAASRVRDTAVYRYDSVGFRVARTF